MKAKFKLGQLVEVKTGDTSTAYQVITGILTTQDGFSYQTKDGFVRQDDVMQVYKSLKTHKKTTKMRASRKPKAVTTDTTQPTTLSS